MNSVKEISLSELQMKNCEVKNIFKDEKYEQSPSNSSEDDKLERRPEVCMFIFLKNKYLSFLL